MQICIIGGSGFVGSKLIFELNKGLCYNIDKNCSPFFNDITTIGDIRYPEQINFKKETSTVILLAAEHKDDVDPISLYYDVNVTGTKNVLNKMDEFGIKNLIFTSSVAVYGLNKSNPDENHFQDPFNHYGKSKLEAEKVIQKWYKENPSEKSVFIVRPTVIFGERNRGNVYNLLKQISTGKFLMIGKGTNKKSMAYVGNIISFINYLLESSNKGLYFFNYTDKPDFSMMELVSIIEKKMSIKIPKYRIPFLLGMLGGYFFDLLSFFTNKKFLISSVRVKKFCATTQFNSDKAHDIFKPPYTLEDGINNTLDFEFINPPDDDIVYYSE